jgi:transposase-like protein
MARRRIYSAEFKREAVSLANQPGLRKSQIGREHGRFGGLAVRQPRENPDSES